MDRIKHFFKKLTNNDYLRLIRGEFYKFFKSSSAKVISVMLILVIILTAVIYQRENNTLSSIFGSDDGENSIYYPLRYGSIEDVATMLRIEMNSEYFDRINDEFADVNKRIILTLEPASYFESINPAVAILQHSLSNYMTILDADLTDFIKSNVRFYRILSTNADKLKELFATLTNDEIKASLQDSASIFDKDKLINSVRVGSEQLADLIIQNIDILFDIYRQIYTQNTIEVLNDLMYYVNGVYQIHNQVYNKLRSDFSSALTSLIIDYTVLYEIQNSGYDANVMQSAKATLERSEQSFLRLHNELEAIDPNAFVKIDNKEKAEIIEQLTLEFKYFYQLFQIYNNILDVGINEVGFIYYDSGTFTRPQQSRDYRSESNFVRDSLNKTLSILDSNAYDSDYKLECLKDFAYELVEKQDGLYCNVLDFSLDWQHKYPLVYNALELSLSATLSEQDFNDNFLSTMSKIEDFFQSIVVCYKQKNAYKQLDMFFEYLGLDYNRQKDEACNDFMQFIDIVEQIHRQTPMINEYVRGMYLSLTLSQNKMSDADLANVYGMINIMGYGISKYSLRSNITKLSYQFENSQSITQTATATGLDNGYGYMSFAVNIVYLFIIIAGIVIASGQIAGEHTLGAIKLLLIRPYKRYKILLSKMIMTFLTILAMIVVSFILLWLIGGIGFGFGSRPALVIFNATKIIIINPFVITLLRFLAMFIEASIYAIIAIMISTIFRSRSGAIAVSMVIYFGSAILGLLLSGYDWYRFILFNNTNLFVYLTDGPSLNDMTLWFSLLVNAIYTATITFATFFIFSKKDT